MANSLFEKYKNTVVPHENNTLTKIINLYYMALLRTWLYWYKLINMVPFHNRYNYKGYYVITFMSEPYILQEETTYDRKISTDGEIIVKALYINFMQDNKKWH